MLVLSVGLSLILYNHGATWWYAPLAFVGIVIAHGAVLGGIVLAVSRTSRGADRDGSGLVVRPRLYDWLVRTMTFGGERRLRHAMLDLADLRCGSAVLDVGCGTGTLLLATAERVGPAGALHGVDLAEEMVTQARKKAAARQVRVDIVEGSADDLPYAPASFDAVFCTLVLHHLPASMRENAVREMRRVLRPGGRVVIADLQSPKSRAKPLRAAMSLISLLHTMESGGAAPDMLDIEPLLTELGFGEISRHSFGSGAIGAIVGRFGSRIV